MSTFRGLVWQALSLDVSGGGIHEVEIHGVDCRIRHRFFPVRHGKVQELGGLMIAIEFQSHTDIDLFDAARAGVELVQDFLFAITAVLAARELVQWRGSTMPTG